MTAWELKWKDDGLRQVQRRAAMRFREPRRACC
jgi:hypothetical protein